jgi:hypothetical protein
VALAAVACCSLVYASGAWSAALYTAAIVFLAFATLVAVYGCGSARAYWVGCAFCGWLYLLLVFGPLSGTQQVNTMGQVNVASELATTHLARWLYGTVLPKLRPPPQPLTIAGLGIGSDAGITGFVVEAAPEGGEMVGTASTGGSYDSAMSATGTSPAGRMSYVVGAGNGLRFNVATASSAAAASYPDETSFIRVSHALWVWLFALAGGMAGKWLQGRRGSPA